MKAIVALPAVILAAGALSRPARAQCHQPAELNATSPAGQLLQHAEQETDNTKKLALLEQFATQYPQHKAAGWVDEQLLGLYVTTQQPDKALAMGDKLSAMPPPCVEDAQNTLKAAEMKKDPDLVLKWSAATAQLAQKVMASPQPQDPDAVADWKTRVDYARQVNTYTEYSLYAMALKTTDPAKQVALLEALQQRNPKSPYLAQAGVTLFLAYQKSGQTDKAAAFAQKLAASGQADEDMLLVLVNDAAKNKDGEKVHDYSAKLEQLLNSKPKPAGLSDADWDKRKNTILGVTYSLDGKQYFNEDKLEPANEDLRKSLPLVQEDTALKTEVLFYLGLANYKMEKIQDAATYFKECAAVRGPFQEQALKNLRIIHSKYRGVR